MAVIRRPSSNIYGRRYSGGGGGSYVPPAPETLSQPKTSALDQPAGTLSATEARTGQIFPTVTARKEATITGATANQQVQAQALANRTQPMGIGRITSTPSAGGTSAIGLGATGGTTSETPRKSQPYYEQPNTREAQSAKAYYWRMSTPEQVKAYKEYRSYKPPVIEKPTTTQKEIAKTQQTPYYQTATQGIKTGGGIKGTIAREQGSGINWGAYTSSLATEFKTSREKVKEDKSMTGGEYTKMVVEDFKASRERIKAGTPESKQRLYYSGEQETEVIKRRQELTALEKSWTTATPTERGIIGLKSAGLTVKSFGIELLGSIQTARKLAPFYSPRITAQATSAEQRLSFEITGESKGIGQKVPAFWTRPELSPYASESWIRKWSYKPVEGKEIEQVKTAFTEKTGFGWEEGARLVQTGMGRSAEIVGMTGASLAEIGGFAVAQTLTSKGRLVARGLELAGVTALATYPEIKRAKKEEGISMTTAISQGLTTAFGFEALARGPAYARNVSPIKSYAFEFERAGTTGIETQAVRGIGFEPTGTSLFGFKGRKPFIGSPAKAVATDIQVLGKTQYIEGTTGTRVETRVMGETIKQRPASALEQEYFRLVESLSLKAGKIKQPVSEVRELRKEIPALGEAGVREIGATARKESAVQFGSSVTEAQLPEGLLATRRAQFFEPKKTVTQEMLKEYGAKDKDLLFPKSEAKVEAGSIRLAEKFSGLEPAREFFVDEALISSRVKGTTGEPVKAVDPHSVFAPTAPSRSFGVRLDFPATRAPTPTVKGLFKSKPTTEMLPVQQLREQALSYGQAVTKVKFASEEGFSFGPAEGRVKDIPSFEATIEGQIGRLKKGKLKSSMEAELKRLREITAIKFPEKVRGKVGDVPDIRPSKSPSRSTSFLSTSFGLSSSSLRSLKSLSKSVSKSVSVSKSPSLSKSVSKSVSVSKSPSLSKSISKSISRSLSVSPSLSKSVSKSLSPSLSKGFASVAGGWALPLPKPYFSQGRTRKGRGVRTGRGYSASLLGIMSGRTIKRAPKGAVSGLAIRLPLSVSSMRAMLNKVRKKGLI